MLREEVKESKSEGREEDRRREVGDSKKDTHMW